jgi:UDP-N-acetylglucosamine transferase subunit ALG13
MIFVSVGTLHGFDRLIKGVDDAIGQGLIQEEVYAQIWSGSYVPQNCAWVRSMDRIIFLDYVKKSSCIISHAGIGVITLPVEDRKVQEVRRTRQRSPGQNSRDLR